MAYESPSFYGTFPASTGLKQYQAVGLNSGGSLINPSSAGANVIGVLVSSGSAGSTRDSVQTVQFSGITKMLAGSTAIAAGNAVSVSAVGAAVVGTTNAKIGIALQGVDSTGGDSTGGIGQQIISVLLINTLQ